MKFGYKQEIILKKISDDGKIDTKFIVNLYELKNGRRRGYWDIDNRAYGKAMKKMIPFEQLKIVQRKEENRGIIIFTHWIKGPNFLKYHRI